MTSCSANLGPREQRKRWITAIAATLGAGAITIACDGHCAWMRAVAAALLIVAAFCTVQAKSKTCILLAYTGQRNLDGGTERIRDLAERREMMRRANLVVVRALFLALAGMLVLAML